MHTSSSNPHSSDTLVALRDVRFGYGERVILDGISLTVPRGKVTALMGASGGGKTTVLRLIGGQYRAQSGSLTFEGQEVGTMNQAELYTMRRRMGMLFQFGALFTDLSVFDNVAFPLREHTDLNESMIRDIVLMKLQAVGLRGARDLMPGDLSGGMSRRVALARAIALEPALAMFDEPFAGLDPISLNVIAELIRRLNDALGSTSIVVTYDVSESLKVVDYIYVIAEGRVMGEGTPEALLASEDPFIKQFLHMLPDGPVRFHAPSAPMASDLNLA